MSKANVKRKKPKVWRGWGAFYRRGGMLCRVFDSEESATAYVGTGYTLLVASVEVREIINAPKPKRGGKGKKS